jgi:hypothetical protein
MMLSTVIYQYVCYYTDTLSPNHLQQILDLVWDARTKYYSIGLALDLPAATIDALEGANNKQPDPTFREVIKLCLQKKLVTLEKLAEAVSSQQVGFDYLSDCILKLAAPQTPGCKLINYMFRA